MPKYRFIDLFAGLGGFHKGMTEAGHRCVFACEVDDELRDIYAKNYGIHPQGDIRKVIASCIPPHDVICAGFPCQPFSKAGLKKAGNCPTSGKLIDDVIRIVRFHNPRYIILENVPNILLVGNGDFWKYIIHSFQSIGYHVEYRIYSPIQYGIPQQRERIFVIASRSGSISWPEIVKSSEPVLSEFLEPRIKSGKLEQTKIDILEHWNDLIKQIKNIASHTIIASEFGATYPLEGLPNTKWRDYSGAFGARFKECASRTHAIKRLPYYAQNNNGIVPKWMHRDVVYSRELYRENIPYFDSWKINIRHTNKSWQKLEWRGDRETRDIWKNNIQFRASGIRVMCPNIAPSLIAMTTTQIPILGKYRRYININEAASLQSLETLRYLPKTKSQAFKALGNAVNAKIVREIGLLLS